MGQSKQDHRADPLSQGSHSGPEPGAAVRPREKVVPWASSDLQGPVGVSDITGF